MLHRIMVVHQLAQEHERRLLSCSAKASFLRSVYPLRVCHTSIREESRIDLPIHLVPELQAVEGYSCVIEHLHFKSTACLSQSEITMLVAALCQRASIYEHLEAYDKGLQDFSLLLQLQPGHYMVSWGWSCDALLQLVHAAELCCRCSPIQGIS